MTNRIKHRGPDDEGYLLINNSNHNTYYGDDTTHFKKDFEHRFSYLPSEHIKKAYSLPSKLYFGHRRLSIIDLSIAGHQPMSYMENYWIVYNGEIYNYLEIRKELAKDGYKFISNSDTEVIMAAFHKWGSTCVNRFNGMWAFILYDSQQDAIFVSRDRFGIKPLYYYIDDSSLILASEIKALLANSSVKTGVNEEYCSEYLQKGPLEYLKETAFKNIFRFKHAGLFSCPLSEIHRGIREETYWNVKLNKKYEKYDHRKAIDYSKRYLELLQDSIRIRLRADVHYGSALSGGLDSSSITYLIQQIAKQKFNSDKLQTFSSVYRTMGTEYCDESDYINQLADFLGVHSNQIEPKIENIIEEHKKVIYFFDNPPAGLNMGGWYTFKCVADSPVTINLDGQGADEQLCGYYKYIWRHIIDLPIFQAIVEAKYLLGLPGINIKNLLFSLFLNILCTIFSRSFINLIFRKIGRPDLISLLYGVNNQLWTDINSNLVNLLHYGDSQSMAHSIESRVPFMDYRLVEFLASIPAIYKIHKGWTKYIARLAVLGKLPNNITWRKDKMGWPDPTEFWYQGPLRGKIIEKVKASPLLSKLGIRQYFMKYVNHKITVNEIFRIYNLVVWYETFFN